MVPQSLGRGGEGSEGELMKEYHKIQSVFKRSEDGKKMLFGQYSLPEFEYLAENEWVFTEKVDGTNIRVMWQDGKVTFGGKTDNAQIPAFLVTRLQELFLNDAAIAKFKEKFPDGCCLYGEGYGAKIQKGGGNYKADGVDFVLFDVNVAGWWLLREDMEEIAVLFGIEPVPIIGRGTLPHMVAMAEAGFDSTWGPFKAEGIVAKPVTELRTRRDERIVTKIKAKDFAG